MQITQLVKHLSVRRQHALCENVGGFLQRGSEGQSVQNFKCKREIRCSKEKLKSSGLAAQSNTVVT